ncbi:hypothetical protein [Zobellella sp. DQSA1]|uniref:hypothetical protein n=1 Tax=Zobellella sp. DQSA1 TaxID=3342386 RepID=UPI0035BF8753
MMNRFNTGNPLDSGDLRDLDDNAKNLDVASNDMENKTFTDRFGRVRKTYHAIEIEVEGLLVAGGQIFDDEPAGRAAVEDGQYFFVANPDPNISKTLRKRISVSGSVWIADDPSAEFLQVIADEQVEQRDEIKVAVDVASDPINIGAEFHSSASESGAVAVGMIDEDGNILSSFDEGGFTTDLLRAEFHSSNDRISLATLDAEGNIISAHDEYGYQVNEARAEFHSDDSLIENAIIDEGGNPLIAWDGDGNQIFSHQGPEPEPEAQALIPYLSGQELRAVGENDELAAELGDYTVLATAPGNGQSVRAVIDQPLIGQTRTVSAGQGLLIPDASKILKLHIGTGQSLKVGATSASTMVSIEPVFPDEALMFTRSDGLSDVRMGLDTADGANPPLLDPDVLVDFEPLVARAGQGAGSRGQTPMESYADELTRQAHALGIQYRSLSFVSGMGGTGYSGMKKGTQVYNNMMLAVARAKTLAAAHGWQVVVEAVTIKHGEADQNNSNYFNNLIEWQQDLDADIKAITSQLADVHILMHMPSSHLVDAPQATIAMLRAHNESPYHHLTGVDYPYLEYYSPDYIHFQGPGYYLIGEGDARGHSQALWSHKRKTEIVQIIDVVRDGTTVIASVSAPAPLVFDIEHVPERDAKGFRFRDNTGDIAISSIEINDDGSSSGIATITAQLENIPSGINESLLYAISPQSSPRTAGNVPRGNLRDSSTKISNYDGRQLYNWAVHQIFHL